MGERCDSGKIVHVLFSTKRRLACFDCEGAERFVPSVDGDEVRWAAALKCSDPVVFEVVDVEAVVEVEDVRKRCDARDCV